MEKYIALLRGINVGGKNSLPMKELATLLTAMKCLEVQTYIQSGNVVFERDVTDGKKLAGMIADTIESKLGFRPGVLILTRKQLDAAVKQCPFPTENGKSLHLWFLEGKPLKPDLDQLENLKTDAERFELCNEGFYLYAPDGIGRSKLAASVEKCLGVTATARNWNTVRKLLGMAH